jgi:hypothetical protein
MSRRGDSLLYNAAHFRARNPPPPLFFFFFCGQAAAPATRRPPRLSTLDIVASQKMPTPPSGIKGHLFKLLRARARALGRPVRAGPWAL